MRQIRLTDFDSNQKNALLPQGAFFQRAIDGTRTRGLDLGKVARYQLRHYRIFTP